MEPKFTYRHFLQKALEQKQTKNPAFNLSAFAHFLKIPPSRLSEILRGKVGISVSKAISIADVLKLNDSDQKLFIDLVRAEHERNLNMREAAKKRVLEYLENYTQYEEDKFSIVADWYHHALLELISLYPELQPKNYADRLGLSEDTINGAIERLISLDIIGKDKEGSFFKNTVNRETTRDIPSKAIKNLNRQMLEKAIFEIDEQSIEKRDYSLAFFGFNKNDIQRAKERIRDFRRDFMKEFELSPDKSSVYVIGIQFYELTGKDEVLNETP